MTCSTQVPDYYQIVMCLVTCSTQVPDYYQIVMCLVTCSTQVPDYYQIVMCLMTRDLFYTGTGLLPDCDVFDDP